ncbi:MAG: YwmB family TATA-box binding protein [Sporolactobacillus sp.]
MTKRKLIALTMIVIALLMAGPAQGKSRPVPANQSLGPMVTFVNAVIKNKSKVIGWSVYAREQQSAVLSKKQWHTFLSDMQDKQPQMDWQALKSEPQVIGWQGQKKLKRGVTAKLSCFAYPSGKGYQTAISYEVDGEYFNKKLWREEKVNIRRDLAQIFDGQEQIFSCVKADSGVKIKPGLINQAENYLKLFSAAPIERLNEKTFVSISAYTKAWNNHIISGNQKMNVQIALRQDDGHTVTTLGTPIITQAY